MKRSLLSVLLVPLAACSNSAPDETDAAYAARVPMETRVPSPRPAPPAPEQPDDAEWREGANGIVTFGVEGSTPLLSLACEDGALGAKRIAITRHFPAPDGTGALLALVGNLRLRIPVDAEPPARWIGSLDAHDERWRILDDRFTATLPGGGMLRLPASPLTRALRTECRARAETPGDMSESVTPVPET
ncbi:hypothetical protein [Pseudoblastomonas halimionae]|uniref:Uncharacterized protein n=1 Tax=Alteriqipengyuania halimionae TaxID=1926630 RepID=A0A6I4U384_9SPHN|nr:hypothetical protein [Alteriqipengyuania halimionae]MXP08667.1 hypothetical protein [Alteriqipengyuania halimionae]